MRATKPDVTASRGATASGGGGKTTSVLAPNVISYNVCDPASDGIVRVLMFNSPRIGAVGLNVYAGCFASSGVNVTGAVPASAYLDGAGPDRLHRV